MTEVQTAAAFGAVFGGMLAGVLVFGVIVAVLLIIAMWKIFTKAGEPGWKSIVPIYNTYILFKISGMKNFFWYTLIASLVQTLIVSIAGQGSGFASFITIAVGIFDLVVAIMLCNKLAKSFGKGIGYTLGLIFLPNIFTLILGFGSAEYVGTPE